LSATDLTYGLGLQAAYTAMMYAGYRLLWQRGMRRYTATGA
jgi:ABC-type uncharacterized transport system permease subunit